PMHQCKGGMGAVLCIRALGHNSSRTFMRTQQTDRVAEALDSFRVELPSWGFSNTGTRFGKYLQPAAAATIEEKFSDAAQVHCVGIARRVHSRVVVLWFADGSNYPGTANIRQRKRWFEEHLRELHSAVGDAQRLLVEYKPFEPAFYHTDIADWGMALAFARA